MKRQLRNWGGCVLPIVFSALLTITVCHCDGGSGWTGCETDSGDSSGGTTTSGENGGGGDPYS